MVLADNVYHEHEKEMVIQLEDICDVSENDAVQVQKSIELTKEAYREFAHFVFRGE